MNHHYIILVLTSALVHLSLQDPTGTKIEGYTFEKRIGSPGANGQVYLDIFQPRSSMSGPYNETLYKYFSGTDEGGNRVAIKIQYAYQNAVTMQAKDKLELEYEILGKLYAVPADSRVHPKVAQPIFYKNDCMDGNNRFAMLVMTLFDGDMAGRKGSGTVDQQTLFKMNADVFDTITVLHHIGYIHLDIKPENIFFDAHNNFYLGDFGEAYEILYHTNQAKKNDRKCKPSNVMNTNVPGTPKYASPGAHCCQDPCFEHDFWSLGYTNADLGNTAELPWVIQGASMGDMGIKKVKLMKDLPAIYHDNPNLHYLKGFFNHIDYKQDIDYPSLRKALTEQVTKGPTLRERSFSLFKGLSSLSLRKSVSSASTTTTTSTGDDTPSEAK